VDYSGDEFLPARGQRAGFRQTRVIRSAVDEFTSLDCERDVVDPGYVQRHCGSWFFACAISICPVADRASRRSGLSSSV